PAGNGIHLPAASHRSPGAAGWRPYALSRSTHCKTVAQAGTSGSRAEGDRRQSYVFDLGTGQTEDSELAVSASDKQIYSNHQEDLYRLGHLRAFQLQRRLT